jgi:hypothetical protein
MAEAGLNEDGEGLEREPKAKQRESCYPHHKIKWVRLWTHFFI